MGGRALFTSTNTQPLQLVLTVIIDLPGTPAATTHDLLADIQPDAKPSDFLDALGLHLGYTLDPEAGLVRVLSTYEPNAEKSPQAYLPAEIPLSACGLVDGITLYVRHRLKWPLPDLIVDTALDVDDLLLVDERGSHRGRITRLPVGVPVDVGSNPPVTGRFLVADERHMPSHAFTLINRDGTYVECEVIDEEGLYLFGTPASRADRKLLPGSSIAFRRTEAGGSRSGEPARKVDYASFVIATVEGAHGRSPLGKVQFDPTARYDTPAYARLQERLATLSPAPIKPEKKPFPIEQVLMPLGLAAALWIFTRSVFSVIAMPASVIIPIVAHQRQRRETLRDHERAMQEWLVLLAESARELSALVGAEEGKLRSECPPAEVWGRRAYKRLAGLWSRDPTQDDFLRVTLGTGELLSRYQVKLANGFRIQNPEFKQVMERQGTIISPEAVQPKVYDVPIVADLRTRHLGIVGPLDLVDYLATDILVQIVSAHPPGAVSVAALLPTSPYARHRFDWLRWLPHTRAPSPLMPSERVVVGRAASQQFLVNTRMLLHALPERAERGPAERYAVLVVHEAAEVDVALLEDLCSSSGELVRIIWMGSSPDSVPQLVTNMVQLEQSKLEGDADGRILTGDPALSSSTFRANLYRNQPLAVARSLAPLYDPRSAGANAGIPSNVPLSAVLPVGHQIAPQQPRLSVGTQLPIPLGIAEGGPFVLDLVHNGPHVLIGGTTGSGKSELLQTLAAGLVSLYRPDEVNLFLVDFKGGATFAPFQTLPHVVGFVSDLDVRNVGRALAFLRAELRRRERILQEHDNAKDYPEYLSRLDGSGSGDRLPRLVIIFDEFSTLVKDFPAKTIDAVIDIAQRGRSWGIHLVLATQRPSRDVVVPPVLSNVTTRIALRTQSPEDSQTIIDRPEAANIPKALPGRALARSESTLLIEFQAAHGGAEHVPDSRLSPVALIDFEI